MDATVGAITVAQCEASLFAAQKEYDEAHKAAEAASRSETNARGKLNEAQKAFDAAVNELRKNPPWNSHWHQGGKHVG